MLAGRDIRDSKLRNEISELNVFLVLAGGRRSSLDPGPLTLHSSVNLLILLSSYGLLSIPLVRDEYSHCPRNLHS